MLVFFIYEEVCRGGVYFWAKLPGCEGGAFWGSGGDEVLLK